MQTQIISSTKNHIHLRFHFIEGQDSISDLPGYDYFTEVAWNNALFQPTDDEEDNNDNIDYKLHEPVKRLWPTSWGALDFWIERAK